jgi:hypothetical protein
MARSASNRFAADVRLELRLLYAGTLGAAMVLGCLVLGEPNAGAVTNLSCGSIVTTSVTLNGTLTCRSYAGYDIEIEASGVTFNLGGHTIVGDRGVDEIGVYLDGYANVTITNGTVETDYGAVYAEDAADFTARGLTVSSDDVGIWLYSTGHALVTGNTGIHDTYGALGEYVGTSTLTDNVLRTSVYAIFGYYSQSVIYAGNTGDYSDFGFYSEFTQQIGFRSNTTNNNAIDGVYIEDAAESGDVLSGNRSDDNRSYGFYATYRVAGGGNIDVGDPDRCHNVTCVIP